MIMYGLLTDERDQTTGAEYRPCDYVYKFAESTAEIEGYWRLRRQVFCEEQAIFPGSDRDRYDDGMSPIICTALEAGMEDRIVGTVRIDERSPGVWWGSRLCVHPDFRKLGSISPGVSVRNCQPGFYAQRSIGAGLIYKAVSTAHALGCHLFLATVQRQNAAFFRRLHWKILEEIELHGRPHIKMEADLDFYPPASLELARGRAA
jgi:GNAT superfamily N-acetyltransferase